MDIQSNFIGIVPPDRLGKRGVIIVDASSLFSLAVDVPDELQVSHRLKNRRSVNFLNILPFLGSHDFSILIPEVVAYETAGVLTSGFALSKYFNKATWTSAEQLYNFFMSSLTSSHINIVSPCEHDVTEAAMFVRALHHIHNDNISRDKKKKRLMSLQARPKKNYGDIAAYKIIENIEDEKVPIFYLSEDSQALRAAIAIRSDIKVHALTTWNFLETLSNTGLLPLVNIKSAHVFRLLNVIHTQRAGYMKWPILNPLEFIASSRDAFAQTLIGIQEEDTYNSKEEFPEPIKKFPEPPSAIGSFNKKFASFSGVLMKKHHL